MEFTYSGRARVEYSGSELGTGIAMRGFIGTMITPEPLRAPSGNPAGAAKD
jgi:hypothetical protein